MSILINIIYVGNEETEYWADWYPLDKKVIFGGTWEGIPDMPADIEPDEELTRLWVELPINQMKFSQFWAEKGQK